MFYAFYYHEELWRESLLFYTRYRELLVYMPKEFQIKNQNNSHKLDIFWNVHVLTLNVYLV